MSRRILVSSLACLVACSAALAVPRTRTETESFKHGSNEGGWFLAGFDGLSLRGGNPGSFLAVRGLDTYAPQPRTTEPSTYTGDYRATRVVALGVDVIVNKVDFSAEGRPLSLLLTSDPGTPDDPADDCTAYLVGTREIPLPGEGWAEFDFEVPSQSPTLPAGWGILEGCPEPDADAAWNRVIVDVDGVTYFYGDPTMFFIFQNWATGIDNPSITRVP